MFAKVSRDQGHAAGGGCGRAGQGRGTGAELGGRGRVVGDDWALDSVTLDAQTVEGML
jgi:hypothetical protein